MKGVFHGQRAFMKGVLHLKEVFGCERGLSFEMGPSLERGHSFESFGGENGPSLKRGPSFETGLWR